MFYGPCFYVPLIIENQITFYFLGIYSSIHFVNTHTDLLIGSLYMDTCKITNKQVLSLLPIELPADGREHY